MHPAIVLLGGLLAVAALETSATAQEELNHLLDHMPAPSRVLELKAGTGYTQGFGDLAPGRSLPDVAGPGVGFNPRWSFGLEGQYQSLSNEQNSEVRGVATTIGGTYHFEPVLRGDPWLRLGTGFRWVWEYDPTGAPGTNVVRYGLEAVSLKLGYDLRLSENAAIGPVIGGDFDPFLGEAGSTESNHALSTAEVGVFVYAGIQGRFDLGGEREEVAALPPVQLSAVSVPAPPATPPPPAPTKEVTPAISVSEDILQACKQDVAAVDKAPKFEFDQADLLTDDLSVLRQIGTCFATGPMKGMTLVLVGRADPRGTVEHNQTLGEKRARSVAAYLEELGVDAQQVQQVSRGKLDASGKDEAGWATDRRVDILLGAALPAK
jgi:peptidoglycan-associated lipoprotein